MNAPTVSGQVAGSESENKDEEWESLPHLDSTMLAHPGGAPAPVMQPVPVKK